jgi:hypothetical protein
MPLWSEQQQIPSLRYGMTNKRRYGMTNKSVYSNP